MTTYAEADLPRLLPGSSDDAAGARAIFAEARAAAPLASGLFGPIVIHHRDVVDLLRDAGLNAHVDQGYLSGPRVLTYHYWGQAQKA